MYWLGNRLHDIFIFWKGRDKVGVYIRFFQYIEEEDEEGNTVKQVFVVITLDIK